MSRLLSALVAVVLVGGWALADDEKKPITASRVEDKKPADDKKADAPTGVWVKKTDEGLTLQLDFTKKDTLVVTATVEDKTLTMTTALTAGKDGKWTAKLTKTETKGDFPFTPTDKYEFSFKVKVEKDKATLSDYSANEHEEEAKGVVEGEYKKAEEKKKEDK
jgi:hypothetical protein